MADIGAAPGVAEQTAAGAAVGGQTAVGEQAVDTVEPVEERTVEPVVGGRTAEAQIRAGPDTHRNRWA